MTQPSRVRSPGAAKTSRTPLIVAASGAVALARLLSVAGVVRAQSLEGVTGTAQITTPLLQSMLTVAVIPTLVTNASIVIL